MNNGLVNVSLDTSGIDAPADVKVFELLSVQMNATSVAVPLAPLPFAKGFALEIELPPDLAEGDSNQRWFWSEEWQSAERQVDADLAAGRFETYDTMDEFLTSLE